MKIPESVIEEVSSKADIVSIVGDYTPLKKKGARYWGCCPFHNEKTPSFAVTQDTGLYYCFGCHKGGGVFQFIMEMESLHFPEAVEFVAQKVGVSFDLTPPSPEEEKLYSERDKLKDLYKRVSASFHYILMNSPQAKGVREYLLKRGIKPETMETFQLGYAPRDSYWLYNFLIGKNYTKGFLDSSGLFSKKYKGLSLFKDRLMFPIFSAKGDVIAFSGRRMVEDSQVPKYINSPETHLYKKSELLYGLWQSRGALRKGDPFILCEGNLDVLSLYQTGFQTAMAPLGTAFTEGQARLIKRFASKGILFFDGDAPGIKASFKAAILAEQMDLNFKAIPVKEGVDPSSVLEEEGEKKLKKIVDSSVNIFNYLLDCTLVSYDINALDGKEEVVKQLFPYIQSIKSEVKRDICLSALAEKLGIDPQSLRLDLKMQEGKSRSFIKPIPKPTETSNRITDELYLMIAVFLNPVFFGLVEKYMGKFEFQDERALLLYKAVETHNLDLNLETRIQQLGNSSLESIVIEKSLSDEFDSVGEELVLKTLRLIRVRNLESRSIEISKILNRSSKDNLDWDLVAELIYEKKTLDDEIVVLKERE